MAKHHLRNVHEWRMRTEDGEKRRVRAKLFGKRWSFDEMLPEDDDWRACEKVALDDLLELRDILARKYQRKHLAWDHLASVEKLIKDRGGSWEE